MSLTVDPSVEVITAAAVETLWRTVPQPDTHRIETVTVRPQDFAASPVLAAYEARAWADLVLSSFARETNLLLPSTNFLVLGTGRVTDALAATLTRFGSRLELAAGEPSGLWEIATRYAVTSRRIHESPFVADDVDVVVTTGEGHPPLTADAAAPGERPLVVVDAGGSASFASANRSVRSLLQIDGPRTVFVVPPVDRSALHHTAAVIRAAYAVLLATVGPQDADTALAEALQP